MSKIKRYQPSYEECKQVMEIIMQIGKITNSKHINLSSETIYQYISTCCYYWEYYKHDENKENKQ